MQRRRAANLGGSNLASLIAPARLSSCQELESNDELDLQNVLRLFSLHLKISPLSRSRCWRLTNAPIKLEHINLGSLFFYLICSFAGRAQSQSLREPQLLVVSIIWPQSPQPLRSFQLKRTDLLQWNKPTADLHHLSAPVCYFPSFCGRLHVSFCFALRLPIPLLWPDCCPLQYLIVCNAT